MKRRRGFIKADGKNWLVGAKDVCTKAELAARGPYDDPYHGPVARVSYDKTWLNIVTDDYEGAAMLNIEALPYLRRALSRIASEIAKAKK